MVDKCTQYKAIYNLYLEVDFVHQTHFKLQLKGYMQQGHNFIYCKIYIRGYFTYKDHVGKLILINNSII